MSRPSVTILMPAYNEEATIETIIKQVLALEFVTELVVVDDCSKDNTSGIVASIEDSRIKLFKMDKNSGKTAAINHAISKATSDICIVQDADLEYDPEEIIFVLEPIFNGRADVVYGSRFLVRKAARVLYYYHFIANKFITFLSNFLTNINLTDVETCYKAFRTPILQGYDLTSKGFGMEIEITSLISKMGLRIYEVPISYYGRTYEEGKKISTVDGIDAIWYIFKYNLWHTKMVPSVKKHIRKVKELAVGWNS